MYGSIRLRGAANYACEEIFDMLAWYGLKTNYRMCSSVINCAISGGHVDVMYVLE